MAERFIETNGIELCAEAFGEPGDPPVLLIAGISGSMLWWDAEFCRMLVDGGRYVIRYDHRDTGRSVTYEPGRPDYTSDDLVADAVGVLDAYGVTSAHVVGVSMGGAIAQLVGLDFPDRIASLVFISTSFAVSSGRKLPPPAERFARYEPRVDWIDADSVVEYLVDYSRVLAGQGRWFDEPAARELARREVARARDFSAARNHELLEDDGRTRPSLSSLPAPVLVIHGTDDPMFPLAHGEALAEAIPHARVLTLDGAGHGVERDDWETIASAVLEHTARS